MKWLKDIFFVIIVLVSISVLIVSFKNNEIVTKGLIIYYWIMTGCLTLQHHI